MADSARNGGALMIRPKIILPFAVFFAALTLLQAFIYRPTLPMFFHSDQIGYFSERMEKPSFMGGIELADIALARRYWKGDEMIYRPFLFIWLALQHYFFSFHSLYWNLTNLALHILLTIVLFIFLAALQPIGFAALFALLFSAHDILPYLVTNSHQGAYMIAYGLFMVAYYAAKKMEPSEPRIKFWLTLYVASLTAASFFIEIMLGLSPILCCLVGRQFREDPGRRKKVLVWMLLPFFTYGTFYFFHAMQVPRIGFGNRVEVDSILSWANLVQIPQNMVSVTMMWIIDLLPRATWQNILLLVSAAFSFLPAFSKDFLKIKYFDLLALAGMMALYTAILCFMRGPYPNSHHTYFLVILLILFIAHFFDFHRLLGRKQILALILLGALVLMEARLARSFTEKIGRGNGERDRYFNAMTRWVDEHSNKPGFSFWITNPPELDLVQDLFEGYPDRPPPPVKRLRLSEIFFYPYQTSKAPREVLTWSEGKFSE